MPGEGGFDMTARHFLGDELTLNCDLFALEILPWACRIVDYGKSVEDLGPHDPVIEKQMPDGSKKIFPNFKYRYFSEDIPCGLIVTSGIVELAGVPTPHMDDVIYW
eukprot:CAMPEP_0198152118 /NCGR_PEP_ID=MMETSP1443-20131203/58552_1 /TAXON_ID=186043 /ORGANISM="Entomoneis sp., Strain CCMP2396" /LENGTH=105 /DNA_ID=CAMNT_0043818035 /DNA_START=51 /DNA_END=366 /DNA_ORIENTATION=-